MKTEKYFLYVRKSSESDEKQIQSIDDQIKVMKRIAEQYKYEIVWEYIESKSAKAPWREQFNRMIEDIKKWKARNIITWKLDRLSRNPIDSWTIQFMLQKNQINKIVTSDRDYDISHSWLLMSVENWMANQYLLDLSKNVLRWLNSKYEKWIRPSLVPIWYLNDIRERSIITDEERFPLVRKIWELMLTWAYLPTQVVKIANEEWWLTSIKKRKSWWKPLSKSSIYRILTNMFYTWYFIKDWELIKWIHKPMITMEEFNKVQKLLWKKSFLNHKPKTREFSYTWMLRCWCCWCLITAEAKTKTIKSTWEIREYTYYHCTKKKKHIKCDQKSIRVELIEKQVSEILNSLTILPRLKEWILWIIKENYNNEIDTTLKKFKSINNSIDLKEKRLKTLTNKLLDELITNDEYLELKAEISNEIIKLKQTLDKLDINKQENLKTTEKIFEFAFFAKEAFENWDLRKKKEIVAWLGKNFILKDWVLALDIEPWFQVIKNELEKNDSDEIRLEPTKKAISFNKTNDFSLQSFKWWECVTELRTFFLKVPNYDINNLLSNKYANFWEYRWK